MACFGQTLQILVSLRNVSFEFIFFLLWHYVTAIKTRSLYICLCFNLRDNLRSSYPNGLLWSNFANFGFASQSQFWIYIFFDVALCDCNQKPKSICMLFSYCDNLTCSSTNGLLWSNFANFGFAPQCQFWIYIFIIVALCDCNQKPKSIYICLCFNLRDNLRSSYTNGLLWSNFANFGFAPQSQFWIYIFFDVALCDCNQKPKSICMSVFQLLW